MIYRSAKSTTLDMVSTVLLYFLILHGATTLKSQDSDFNTEHGYHVAGEPTSCLWNKDYVSKNHQFCITFC